MARRKKSLGARVATAVIIALVVVGAALGAAEWSARHESPVVISPTASEDAARLDRLAVQAYDPAAPAYDRSQFGQAWSDDVSVEGGHNGCDTRNDILARDLTGVTFKPGTRNCVVLSGHLSDPYTGQELDFQRGQGTSELVQIDHVVPLADAWYAGASQWSVDKRQDFANDPSNLQATTKEANQAKKAKTADEWLPSNQAYECTYARRIIAVKDGYGLAVTQGEKQALRDALATCGE
ncbi:HNH endonuclease family protein [Corynebacterium vitaeruminis]|uniref:HNH endonuclease family protein n=1 Tax=Corynebacterium vitaeruminis TaxID=38305 RepID=UPI00046D3D1A|nr:HNH endonuclease family protein [Corynebacterium vitaeruminis]